MPLHCAAIRPKFVNVQYLSFPNPVLARFLRTEISIFKILTSLSTK